IYILFSTSVSHNSLQLYCLRIANISLFSFSVDGIPSSLPFSSGSYVGFKGYSYPYLGNNSLILLKLFVAIFGETCLKDTNCFIFVLKIGLCSHTPKD